MTAVADILEGDKDIAYFLCSVGLVCSVRSVRRWRHLLVDPLPHTKFHGDVRAQRPALLAWMRRHGHDLTP